MLNGGRTSKIKKIVILGSNGQLGSILSQKLSRLNHKVSMFTKETLNITDHRNVSSTLSTLKPDFLVNCAAWTDVNSAEKFPAQATLVNAKSLLGISKTCLDLDIKLIHVSTDHVFSGTQSTPYTEDSERIPVNHYGKTKLAGENIIENLMFYNYWIIRTSWLYGNSNNDFISKVLRKYTESIKDIPVVCDHIGHPTLVNDLADKIIEILDVQPKFGTYHASNSTTTTWFEFAQESIRLLGLDINRIIPIEYSQLALSVKRPKHVELDFSSWSRVGLKPMRNWRLALSDCLKEGGLNVKYKTTQD